MRVLILIVIIVVTPILFGMIEFQILPNLGLPFGYYGDYNILKRAIEDAGCRTEHEIVNHDVTLEEIDFTIRTGSGWKLEMFFSQNRNMRQLCERPEGLLFLHPSGNSQVYSLASLNEFLKEENIEVNNIRDILRNFDLIGPILRANFENDQIPRTSALNDAELRKYLNAYEPWRPSTSELPRVNKVHSTATSQRSEAGAHGLQLRRLEFEVHRLSSDGGVKEKNTAHALCYVEDLGSGVTVDMVQIPRGKFLMGTSFEEAPLVQAAYVRFRGKDFGDFWQEGPPHTVTVPAFYMGRFEVTQAQWRAVSMLPEVNTGLPRDPSRYKGDDRPVENVSWEEAMEFCARLSRATGRQYRLPTEPEWEYACRAGTTTQFSFGDSVTTDFASYHGVYPYGSVGWGADRGETTSVGSFAPNAFGLYDMHGNVAELCLDPWHDNYNGAPSDGNAWIANGDPYIHVVRGGTFGDDPPHIRAASRSKCYNPTNGCYDGGLRVIALADAR